ncbi:hypothetical protein [Clostridium perfringens]|uniref:hypothetical protein n=1 Tax=Clostridium perfringens TaxID=1502 RepID=UPI0039E9CE7F
MERRIELLKVLMEVEGYENFLSHTYFVDKDGDKIVSINFALGNQNKGVGARNKATDLLESKGFQNIGRNTSIVDGITQTSFLVE